MTPPTTEYREIQLTQGQVAYVSPHRFEELLEFGWYAIWDKKGRCFYARRNIYHPSTQTQTSITMHRHILGLEPGDPREADHVNRKETLNNTDSNLEIADRSQQVRNRGRRRDNTSGYKGVSFNNEVGKWVARIWVRGRRVFLGYFDAPDLAYAAYCEKAKEEFGDKAYVD